jgi:hypothetical protein
MTMPSGREGTGEGTTRAFLPPVSCLSTVCKPNLRHH